jgi:hypothetical protein
VVTQLQFHPSAHAADPVGGSCNDSGPLCFYSQGAGEYPCTFQFGTDETLRPSRWRGENMRVMKTWAVAVGSVAFAVAISAEPCDLKGRTTFKGALTAALDRADKVVESIDIKSTNLDYPAGKGLEELLSETKQSLSFTRRAEARVLKSPTLTFYWHLRGMLAGAHDSVLELRSVIDAAERGQSHRLSEHSADLLVGWRDELYPVATDLNGAAIALEQDGDKVMMEADRCAFGIEYEKKP